MKITANHTYFDRVTNWQYQIKSVKGGKVYALVRRGTRGPFGKVSQEIHPDVLKNLREAANK